MRPPHRQRQQSGQSVAEMVTVLAILAALAAVAVPSFQALRRKEALRTAVGEIRSVFHAARSRAIARDRNVALRFTKVQGIWTYELYEDGDGDGVRNDDIKKKVDPLIRTARLIGADRAAATVGFPEFPITDPDTGAKLNTKSSPVKFNNAALCSFSSRGTATAGSIYLTNTHHDAVVVRVFAATAKIRSLRFDRGSKKWR